MADMTDRSTIVRSGLAEEQAQALCARSWHGGPALSPADRPIANGMNSSVTFAVIDNAWA